MIRTLAAALATGTCVVALATPAAAQTREYNIPAGSLKSALDAYVRQSGRQVVYRADQVRSARSPGTRGQQSAEAALAAILAGSGFTTRVDGNLVAIVKGGNGPAAAKIAASSGDADESATADIVVTAQKREERLVDVPMSVAVLSGETLQRRGYTQFRDFANEVAGLTYTTAGAGYTQISLRGVTTGTDVSATVGVYVDDVPFGSSSAYVQGGQTALDVGLFDVDRIEVLRGPQGTLYGASTMGGLLKYVTVRPSLTESSGTIQAGASTTRNGGESYNIAAAVSTPIATDTAGIRLSGFYSHDGGYIDNILLGEENVNQSNVYGGRADILLKPADGLEVRLTGFIQNIDRAGQGTSDYLLNGNPETGSLIQRRFVSEPFTQQFRLASGTISYDFGPAALTSITSYQTSHSEVDYDVTRQQLAGLRALSCDPGIPCDRNYSAVGLFQELQVKKFTQEVRFGSSGRHFIDWLLGGFYTDERSFNRQLFTPRAANGGPAVNDIYNYFAPSNYQEVAAFGNVTVNLSERFDVSGGLRWAQNKQDITQIGSGRYVGSRPLREAKEDVVTYLANARFHLSPMSTLYARFATGYRPGGPNPVLNDPTTGLPPLSASYNSDSLKSYEVGAKLGTSDGRYGMELAAYQIDWDDIQVIGTRGIFSVRVNAGTARVRGIEGSITARPILGLNLRGNFAYQDAKLTENAPDIRAVRGERLPNVPEFTAAGSADYEFTGDYRPSIGMTVKHVSTRRASFNASTLLPQYILPSYTSVDLRAGLDLSEVKLQLYVRNLFDERGQLSATYRNSFQVAIQQPRTFGLSLSTAF